MLCNTITERHATMWHARPSVLAFNPLWIGIRQIFRFGIANLGREKFAHQDSLYFNALNIDTSYQINLHAVCISSNDLSRVPGCQRTSIWLSRLGAQRVYGNAIKPPDRGGCRESVHL